VTVPSLPAPRAGDLLRALKGRARPFDPRPWSHFKDERSLRVFRRGSLALAASAQALRAATGRALTLRVPAYFCSEALQPLREQGVRLHFYPIGEDLEPDWERIAEAPDVHPEEAQAFLLVHFFGFPRGLERASEFCAERSWVRIDDAAHLAQVEGLRPGPFLIQSPRKVLAVPAGGLLFASAEYAPFLPDPRQTGVMEHTASWLTRRLVQKSLVSLRVSWHRVRPFRARRATKPIDASAGCDPFALGMLNAVAASLPKAAAKRRANFLRLLESLPSRSVVRPLHPQLSLDACPFALPLVCEGDCGPLVEGLNGEGVPALRWPDLPPEVLETPERFPTAIDLAKRLFLIPVHQELSERHLLLMEQTLHRALQGGAA